MCCAPLCFTRKRVRLIPVFCYDAIGGSEPSVAIGERLGRKGQIQCMMIQDLLQRDFTVKFMIQRDEDGPQASPCMRRRTRNRSWLDVAAPTW